jgi:glycerate 2-kinase
MVVPERPVLVAPDAFAGRFRAPQVAAAIGRGLERAGLRPPDLCPVAGGGPGTLEVLLTALGGETAGITLPDGSPAGFALLEDGATAVVEPTGGAAGTDALIRAAADSGAQVVLLCGAAAGPPRAGVRVLSLSGRDGAALVLDALGFDQRARAARAVVTGEGRLDQGTLEGRPVGEIGIRTRQAGVPLHAIVGQDALDAFGKRMIDLQVVREATTLAQVEAAADELGRALAAGRA